MSTPRNDAPSIGQVRDYDNIRPATVPSTDGPSYHLPIHRPRFMTHTIPRALDADIRNALVAELSAVIGSDERMVSELGIWGGTVRADLAVIGPARLTGFEIKSEADSLSRLPLQADIYGLVFDRITAIAAPRHVEGVLARVPHWWGVRQARLEQGMMVLSDVRAGSDNPEVVPLRLAGMLWKDECVAVLARRPPSIPTSRLRLAELHEAVATRTPPAELRGEVAGMLLARTEWIARRDPTFIGPHRAMNLAR